MKKILCPLPFILTTLLGLTGCSGITSNEGRGSLAYSSQQFGEGMVNSAQAGEYQRQAAQYLHNHQLLDSVKQLILLQPSLTDAQAQRSNVATIWSGLQHVSLPDLRAAQNNNPQGDLAGWLALAIISKTNANNTPQLAEQITQWEQQYPNHPAHLFLPPAAELQQLAAPREPQHIALLLPLQGQLGHSGQVVRNGFLSAYYEASSTAGVKQTLKFYDTSQDNNVSAVYQRAISEGADVVIGPLTKDKVQDLARSGNISVDTVALNYLDAASNPPSRFYQFGLSPIDEAYQVANLAWRHGHTNALIIAPQSEWGQRISRAVIARWELLGGHVADTLYFTTQEALTDEIANLLKIDLAALQAKGKNKTIPQHRQDMDMIFLLAQPTQAREIIPLLKFYYAGKVPVYGISTVYSGTPDPGKDSDLDGVIFCDIPWLLDPNSPVRNMTNPSATDMQKYNRLYAVGRDAYTLSNNLQRLAVLPNFPVHGATGDLTLNPGQQVYRKLEWARIQDGHI